MMNNNPNDRLLRRPLPQLDEPVRSFVVLGEAPAVDRPTIENATRSLLAAIGEDPSRQGLLKTPERVARMWEEITSGYNVDPEKLINDAIFDVDYEEMVLVKDIEFFSLCEHHLLPFFGRAHVAYIPNGKVIGLSKIPRIVEMFARRLQVQERLTSEVARFLQKTLNACGVAVVIEASHMCAMMRGVKKPETNMTTSAFLGEFKQNVELRKEFLGQVNRPYRRG